MARSTMSIAVSSSATWWRNFGARNITLSRVRRGELGVIFGADRLPRQISREVEKTYWPLVVHDIPHIIHAGVTGSPFW